MTTIIRYSLLLLRVLSLVPTLRQGGGHAPAAAASRAGPLAAHHLKKLF